MIDPTVDAYLLLILRVTSQEPTQDWDHFWQIELTGISWTAAPV